MLILGIETSSTQVSCALGGPDGVLAAAQVNRGQRHAELLSPMIGQVCDAAGVPLASVEAVAVGVGPGLFTGLRVGLATAKAIAFGLGVPAIGVGSLDLLAFPVRFAECRIVAVSDARRSEVFWATYRSGPDGFEMVDAPRVGPPAALRAELEAGSGRRLLVGDGARRYRDVLARPGSDGADGADVAGVEFADAALAQPSAWSLVQVARARALAGGLVAPDDVQPLYLRKPDAEANWVQRPGSGGPGA